MPVILNNTLSFMLATAKEVFTKLGYVMLAIVILLFMITVHEFGHYVFGRIFKFKINEFAIGMGPKLFSRKNKKTGEVFSLRLVPLGGFCAFEGEDEENPSAAAFNNQKPFKRLIVLFGGAFFNFLSAILIAIIALSCLGEPMPVVANVYSYSPNYANQTIKTGDILMEVNGKSLYAITDLNNVIANADTTMSVVVFRPDERYIQVKQNDAGDDYLSVSVTSLKNGVQGDILEFDNVTKATFSTEVSGADQEYTGLGIMRSSTETGVRSPFFRAISRSFGFCFETGKVILKLFGELITGIVGLEAVGGPITTISQISTGIQESGFYWTVYMIILISVNLAVFNLLPVPALDGCRMIFVIIEWIAGKPVNRKVEAIIHTVGLFALLAFVVIIDIIKLL